MCSRSADVPARPQGDARMTWLDTAKGLGLFLVVFGHLSYWCDLSVISRAIYSFHVPMFFMTSGFIAKIKADESFGAFLKKRVFRLLLPALIFMAVAWPLYFWLSGADILSAQTWMRMFFVKGQAAFNDPVWFLIVLFEVEAANRLLRLSAAKPPLKLLFCLLTAACGAVVYRFDIFLPFGLDRAVIGMTFFLAGILARDAYTALRDSAFKVWTVCLPVLACGWFVTGVILNKRIAVYSMHLGNYWYFLAAGLCGSLSFWWLCRALDGNRIAAIPRAWSANGVFIIGTHYFLTYAFRRTTDAMGIHYTWMYDAAALVFVVALMFLYQPVCRWVDEKLPLLNGKYKGRSPRESGGD